jgi:hypothetical protein
LQTSLDISQRSGSASIGADVSPTSVVAATSSAAISPPPSTFSGLRCSTNETCRQEFAPSVDVLS